MTVPAYNSIANLVIRNESQYSIIEFKTCRDWVCPYVYNVYTYIYIREYGSTLYVGLACAISPTNTNFWLTFLLTQPQEALYEDLAV